MEDYFEETSARLFKTISNGEECVRLYKFKNGDVRSSDGHFFANVNDDSFEDALENFECGWRKIHWTRSDWADWYGCNEDEVEDCMDDDLRDWY